jgi:hypothetical protein
MDSDWAGRGVGVVEGEVCCQVVGVEVDEDVAEIGWDYAGGLRAWEGLRVSV